MSYEDVELMRRRAERFLRNALRLVEEGDYDIAIFSAEQYCQLMLKYKLLIRKGVYPRTHSLRRLIKELGEINGRVLTLIQDIRNLHYIARLEEAYIASRYLPIEYGEAEVRDLIRFILEVFKPIVEQV